jgi:hypothetical protein
MHPLPGHRVMETAQRRFRGCDGDCNVWLHSIVSSEDVWEVHGQVPFRQGTLFRIEAAHVNVSLGLASCSPILNKLTYADKLEQR